MASNFRRRIRPQMPRFRGKMLYYLSSVGSNDQLWRFEEGKSAPLWGGLQAGIVEPPAISPDGRRIAVVTSQGGKRRLQLVISDGAESRSIAQTLDVEGSTDWSQDGRWLVTGGTDGGGEGLFKTPADGGARRSSLLKRSAEILCGHRTVL